MSGDIQGSRSCELIQDDLAELSLGTLFGRRRSEVLDHVESCSHCTAALERLSTVADALLLLAPEIEPPLGFESRLAEKLQAPATRRRPRRLLRVSVLSAAAMIVVALVFVLGARATPPDVNHSGQSAAVDLARANLTSHGRLLGKVVISRGSPRGCS
jgi:anti-sigma factor RsiW